MKILRANKMERCIGCHSCSLACARLVHRKLSWNTAGIRIASAGGLSTGFEAHLCVACDPAPCAAACPTGSLTQRKGGGVKQERDLCIRCGKCAAACPVDAIYMEPEENAPYLCIHCGRCVAFCPHGCLELADAPEPVHEAAGEGGSTGVSTGVSTDASANAPTVVSAEAPDVSTDVSANDSTDVSTNVATDGQAAKGVSDAY